MFSERRLCQRGDLKQLGRDIGGEPWPMAPLIAFSKLPSAAVGEFSDSPAQPLGTSAVAFTARDVRSAVGNVMSAAGNLITLHPIRAAGNLVKGVMDVADIPFDLFINDAGSAVLRKVGGETRSGVSHALAA